MQRFSSLSYLLVGALCVAAAAANALSIEREPVRVTPLNSGPKYELDDVERMPISGNPSNPSSNTVNTGNDGPFVSSVSSSSPSDVDTRPFVHPMAMFNPFRAAHPSSFSNGNSEDDQSMHSPVMAVRRIIIFAPRRDESSSGADRSSSSSSSSDSNESSPPMIIRTRLFGGPSMMSSGSSSGSEDSPFFGRRQQPNQWVPPFSFFRGSQSGPQSSHEVSPAASSAPEVEAMPDPFQLMLEMVHRMFEARINATQKGDSPFSGLLPPAHDLNDAESAVLNGSSNNNKDADDKEGAPAKPTKPIDTEETTSEVIEIDGEKFLKKTTIKTHIDHGVYFVTKKLTTVPLNETTEALPTTTTTTTKAPEVAVAANEEPKFSAEPSTSTTTTTQQTPTTTVVSALEKENESSSTRPSYKDEITPVAGDSSKEPLEKKQESKPEAAKPETTKPQI